MLFDNTGCLEIIIVCMGFTDFSIIEFNREFRESALDRILEHSNRYIEK